MYALDSLATMLQSASARQRFLDWPKASRILVYDTDAGSLADRPTLLGLARKFRASGFTKDIAWLKGGLHAVWRERPDLADSTPLPDEEDEVLPELMSKSLTAPPLLHGRRLPQSAFGSSSTMRRKGAPTTIGSIPLSAPGGSAPFSMPPTTPAAFNLRLPGGGTMSSLGTISESPTHRPVAVNPFFDAVRQNLELAHRSNVEKSAGIVLRLPRRVRRRVGELPFEWLRAIARRSGRMYENDGDYTDSSVSGSDIDNDIIPSHPSPPLGDDHRPDDGSESPLSSEELTKDLETQFYKIELGEQKRLMGVMEHHTGESMASGLSGARATHPPSAVEEFPFSITAGLEKGAKNRYKNIWPFEHARVRLRKARPDDDDYMNASYVQPLGTTKRYIATQGPLATTFDDFWALCWEQNVHVIIMLTREVEAATIKCGKYWAEGSYGPLRLRLLSTDDTPERERKRQESESGSFFANAFPADPPHKRKSRKPSTSKGSGPAEADEEGSTVHRVFELTNILYPSAKPRIVTQFQYLDWPDFNVPADPRGVLHLMNEVDETVEKARGTGDRRWGEGPLHSGPWDGVSSAPQSKVATEILGHVPGTSNDIDAATGVALHALGNPPVLLHCSAGVGRTGGFIAVDAVLDGIRREIRKRRQERPDTALGVPSRSPGPSRASPVSRSSSCGVPMEVDSGVSDNHTSGEELPTSSRQSPSTEAEITMHDTTGPALTMPLSAGGNEVHVPVAGFTDAMQVDDPAKAQFESRPLPDSSPRSRLLPRAVMDTLAAPLLQASPALVDEVRRATLSRNPTNSSQGTAYAAWREDAGSSTGSYDKSKSSSGSASGSGSQWGLAEGPDAAALLANSEQAALSASPPTSYAMSTSSLSAMAKQAAELSLRPSKKKSSMENPPVSLTTLETSQSAPAPPSVVAETGKANGEPLMTPGLSHFVMAQYHALPSPPSDSPTSRLDTWRTEVANSPKRELPLQPMTVAFHAALPPTSDGRTFQYSRPRKLHGDTSPPLLSTYDEPIRRVIEDMREQRMSLCQSLRQYVFVHRAVIEGALLIIDEDKDKATRRAGRHASHLPCHPPESRENSRVGSVAEPHTLPSSNSNVVHASPLASSSITASPQKPSPVRSIPSEDVYFSLPTTSPGKSKRGPSPTELTRQDWDGAPFLLKRPSLKRPSRTAGNSPQPLAFEPVSMTSASLSLPDLR